MTSSLDAEAQVCWKGQPHSANKASDAQDGSCPTCPRVYTLYKLDFIRLLLLLNPMLSAPGCCGNHILFRQPLENSPERFF